MDTILTIDPSTGEKIAEYIPFSDEELQERLTHAEKAGAYWRELDLSQRIAIIDELGERLESHLDEYAELMAKEMGKVLKEARAELQKCIALCTHYVSHAAAYLEPEEPVENTKVYPEPIGSVLAVMPWNFPFWQVFRCAVPALLAGNTVLLKHSPNVSGCAVVLEDLFLEAGCPQYTFQSLFIHVDKVADVVAHPSVRGVALTGSTRAGSAVASLAGKYIKHSVLELGGSDPMVVLEDADLKAALKTGMLSRFGNAGQSCIAAKRWIVVDKVYDEFLDRSTEAISKLRQGNPFDEAVDMGPLARQDLADHFMQQYTQSVNEGAKQIIPCRQEGCHIKPGLLAGVEPGMTAFREELFGPCAVMIRANDVDHAIELANDTTYGLGASVWTADVERGKELARRIQAGNVFINSIVRSDPAVPFGGIGMSGYGRELGKDGIWEFVNRKVVRW
jgi:succinate-semialdehyde dehydrogenase/glutarate-semialdehyde dehydrogenase